MRDLGYSQELNPHVYHNLIQVSDENPAVEYNLDRKLLVNPERLKLLIWLLDKFDKDTEIHEVVPKVRAIVSTASEDDILLGKGDDWSVDILIEIALLAKSLDHGAFDDASLLAYSDKL